MSVLTLTGNLTGDPELRYTASGTPVANFTVAETPRVRDADNPGEFKDGETIFMRCSAWRELAERVAESLHRGDRVVVTGKLKSRSYEVDHECGKPITRVVFELDVEDVGASCKFATLTVKRAQRTSAPESKPWPASVPA